MTNRFHCTACDHRFEVQDSAKPRCPSCMRVSSVSEESERAPLPWRRVLAFGGGVLVAAAAIATIGHFASGEVPTHEPSAAAPSPTVTVSELPPAVRAQHATVLEHAGAAEAVPAVLGSVTDPKRAAFRLAALIRGQLEAGTLHLIDESRPNRRSPLSAELLADGPLAAIVAREEVYLYPMELTILLAAVCEHAGVEHDIVVLEPETRRTEERPQVAIRFLVGDAGLALDPARGKLRTLATSEPGAGPELLWSEHAATEARRALALADFDVAEAQLDAARALFAGNWTHDLLAAELALAGGDLEAARTAAQALAEGDHPSAWYMAARVEAHADPATADEVLALRLAAIVEAFPSEATLAVALGDILMTRGRHADALETYELALQRSPEVVGAHTGLARLHAAIDPSRARRHLRTELGRHVDSLPAYLALGELQLMYGDLEDAERTRQRGRAIAANPEAFDTAWSELQSRLSP